MEFKDDRTEEQRATHSCLVIGTDTFMSGWGGASGGKSFAAWACRDDDRKEVLAWVEGRSDMSRVRVTWGAWKPRGCVHAHVYVVDENHPAIARKRERAMEIARDRAAWKSEGEACAGILAQSIEG